MTVFESTLSCYHGGESGWQWQGKGIQDGTTYCLNCAANSPRAWLCGSPGLYQPCTNTAIWPRLSMCSKDCPFLEAYFPRRDYGAPTTGEDLSEPQAWNWLWLLEEYWPACKPWAEVRCLLIRPDQPPTKAASRIRNDICSLDIWSRLAQRHARAPTAFRGSAAAGGDNRHLPAFRFQGPANG